MCKPQLRTLGLLGEVVKTDFKNDLVEVETYLKEEGILVDSIISFFCSVVPFYIYRWTDLPL